MVGEMRLSESFCVFHLQSENTGNGEENRLRPPGTGKGAVHVFFFRQINSMHGLAYICRLGGGEKYALDDPGVP